MSNTIITTVGTNYVVSAHNDGALIAIKYWLPIYDERIDPDIRTTNTSLSAIADVATETIGLTQPYGEILWNEGLSYYELSDTTDYVYVLSGFGETRTGNVLTNSKQTKGPTPINLNVSTGVPLKSHYAGTAAVTSGDGKWVITGISAIDGVESDYNTNVVDTTKFFTVVDYYPVVSGDNSALLGNFVCRLSENIGTIKFNKIALYVTQFVGGVESANPEFFGEAYLNAPIKKSFFGDGFNEITIDVQMLLSASGLLDNNIFYSTSGDYWSKVPNGLHAASKISVGNFATLNSEPQATVHIGRTLNENGGYESFPHVRIEGVTSAGVNIYRDNFDLTVVPSSLGLSTPTELRLSGSADYAVVPYNVVTLGKTTYPFKSIVLSGATFVTTLNYTSPTLISTKENYLKVDRESIKFYDNDVYSSATYKNTVYGADLVRDYNDLLVQTRLGDIYILAGSKNQAQPTDSMNLRHLYAIADVTNEYPLSSTDNWNVSGVANIVARGGIKAYGTLELNYIPKDPSSWSNVTNWGVMTTKKKYMSIMAGLKLATAYFSTYQEQYDYILSTNISNGVNWNPIGTYIDSSSILFIQANSVKVWGDILPQFDTTASSVTPLLTSIKSFNLGGYANKFYNLYSELFDLDIYDPLLPVGSTYSGISYLCGLKVTRTKVRSSTNTTTLIPRSSSEEVYIGSSSLPATAIYSSKLNIPGVFNADLFNGINLLSKILINSLAINILDDVTISNDLTINTNLNVLGTSNLKTTIVTGDLTVSNVMYPTYIIAATDGYIASPTFICSDVAVGGLHYLKWYNWNKVSGGSLSDATNISFSNVKGVIGVLDNGTTLTMLSNSNFVLSNNAGDLTITYTGSASDVIRVTIFYQ